ncbi:MAG TPA: Uma2 family endonuclease [Candidatus Acidoferrales bacterium]|nr:Uma2 family endonuclease [Candidatus Acidoferrales bacterium]
MTAQPHEPLTGAEFPTWELGQQSKHEFVDGHVYSFAGGTTEHNAIAMIVAAKILPAALPCRTYGSDMLIEMATSVRYADVVVTCDERDRVRGRATIQYPKLIIEILLESTARDDLGSKMREYQTIGTLEEYVLIDSRKRWAQAVRRHPTSWTLEQPVGGGLLELRSVAVAIDLDDLYAAGGVPV